MKKFVIIGAGILGASAAYHLAKKGADVIVADSGEPGQATGAAAGIICPWISQRRNQAWYTLAKNGARYYPELIRLLEQDGERETGYAKVGAVSLHKDEKKIIAMEQRALKRFPDAPEMGEIKRIEPWEASSLFPPLSNEYYGLHVSGAARVDGRKIRDALIGGAKKHGAQVISGKAELLFQENEVTGVRMNQETIRTDQVIVCAGAWASQLFKPLGISFQVHVQKAQIVHLELPDRNTGNWPVLMPPGTQYMLAFPNGRLVAGTTHEDTEQYDSQPTAGGIAEVLQKAIETAPGLENAGFKEARVGFRPFTEGFLPVIGPIPNWKGLLAANGLGSSGLTMGPYLGSELARLAMDEQPEIDLSLYDPAKTIQFQ
ncbi:FAD-binding oxidoreductase [Bacillus sp. FJAT-42376]|uniref:NAD(P)/FAD-dependent oxidoreductase n=1 Tax=Bacillus sp. FJAT-42376 TaxID=2014076 RepID=UPI000F5142BA|nr:FAD-binding oxidoreductase [Bacillus sp. FJAT-42376]AZB43132.1 FAD-binding oxidoreductase [Bacillus sp. FJAT-42376]